MRRLPALVLCAWLLALPVWAEPPRSFDAVLDALDAPLSRNDTDAAFALLSGALRAARVGGWLTPDWAIFYAMQADFARLTQGNPAYALQLTEDGLELIAGDPAQSDFAAALRISRAYALADLGHLSEAADQARLALPELRRLAGAAEADDLAARAAQWAEGRLSEFNTAATDLARQALDQAHAAAAAGAPGRAISLAAGAVLPLDTGLPEAAVRAINFEAETLVARALVALGRFPESVLALRRAIDHLARSPWQPPQPVAWWGDGWDPDSRAVVFAALTDLATRAMQTRARDLATAALREAAAFADDGEDRILLLLLQASLSFRGGDSGAALDLIAETRAGAEAAGDTALVAMTVFYDAVVRARSELVAGRPADSAPVVAAAEAALALGATQGGIDRLQVLSDAATLLAQTRAHDTALIYAREVLRRRQADLAGRDDTAFAETQARRDARQIIEVFLNSAHAAAGGLDPARGENCPPDPGFQSCLVVARRR